MEGIDVILKFHELQSAMLTFCIKKYESVTLETFYLSFFYFF